MWGVGFAVEFEGEGLFGGRVRKRKMGPVVRDKMCVGGKDARGYSSDIGGAGGGEGGGRGRGFGEGEMGEARKGAAPEFVVGLVHGFLGFVGGVRSCCVYEGG